MTILSTLEVTSVQPVLAVPFTQQPNLFDTMDIQIPALLWEPTAIGYRRTYHLGGEPVPVQVAEGDRCLQFFYDTDPQTAAQVANILRATFPTMISDLHLDGHPALRALKDRYRGVLVMHADPFEALVVTILSQNRTGEIVRAVFPKLAERCGGITPATLAALDPEELRVLIRPAGPYKAPRLAATSRTILADGGETFRKTVLDGPVDDALAYLESLPGVAHKTAACVLVFGRDSVNTLPVDTHLFRVVDRLGLARHDGTLNNTTRRALISELLSYGPALAPAHFLFLLVGRTTCTATTPRCPACFLRPSCRSANSPTPPPPNPREP